MVDLVFLGPPVPHAVSGGFGETGGPYPATGHRGVDYDSPLGTECREMAGGKVHAIHKPDDGWGDGSFGNMVVIDHLNTPWYSGYAHLSSFGDIIIGQVIPAGTIIGKTGATGKVTGPHLHHQLTKVDAFPADISTCDDPRKYIKIGSTSDERIASLEAKVRRLEGLMAGYGLLGPSNTTGKADLFGEDALKYANERQFSALLGVQLGGVKDAEIVRQLLLLAANSSASLKEDLISGLTDLLAKLERK